MIIDHQKEFGKKTVQDVTVFLNDSGGLCMLFELGETA